MSEEIETRRCYPRNEAQASKMKFAFFWTLVKLVIMVGIFLGGLFAPIVTVESMYYTYQLLLPICVSGFFLFGTYKIWHGDWRNRTAFGVCDLLFGSFVAGIVLLCCEKDD